MQAVKTKNIMKELKIKREKQLVSGISSLKIFVEGEFVGILKNGEVKSFFYDKDKLDLKIKYYWLSTEIKQVELLNNITSFTIQFNLENKTFIFFGILINLLAISAIFSKNSLVLILFFLILTYFIYILMFKKNRLLLKKQKHI